MSRRRPVPREWRDVHHDLDLRSRYYSRGAIRGSRVYRAGGRCSCGQTYGLRADVHNMERADVLDAWLDHVEATYYAPVQPEQIGRMNDMFAQTYNLDEHYGGTRGADIAPILRGRRLDALTVGEADQLIDRLVELRDAQ